MSQDSIKEMLAAWEKSRAEPANTPLPQRFYDVRKRPTGKPRISTGGITPQGEALRAKELGLDEKTADPLRHSVIGEPEYAWVPDGEPGSYKGSREAYMPLD
jgi:hypothetical protein